MSIIEKIVRILVIVGVAICMILAVKNKDWTQGIFWLLTILTLTLLPGVPTKNKR